MPRNGSGSYSIPNTISPGDQVLAGPVQDNFSDIATALTASIAKDGQTTMTGQFKAANGSAAAPGVTFGADTDTGFFRKSANVMGIAVGGAEVGSVSSDGIADASGQIIGSLPTGMLMAYVATTAPSGWVRANGRTIGNASSGGTERAAADTEDLFELLWNSYSDSVCAVSSGRGASAAADYAANKTISTPDLRGRSIFGLDDMGGSAAGRLGTVITDETTNGASGGTETHTLTQAQLPNVSPSASASTSVSGTVTIPSFNGSTFSGGVEALTDPNGVSLGGETFNISASASTTVTVGALGSGAAHSNLPPAFLSTWIIKL